LVKKPVFTSINMDNSFFASLITSIFVGGAAGYLGSLMVTRRMALVGDALGHVALPGMGLALILGLDVSLGAFIFLFLGIILIWLFGLRTSLPMEALVGIVFVTSLAVGFLIIPEPELLESLIGDISQVSFQMALIASFLSLVVIFVIKKIYSGLILANISEDLALVEKINVKKQNIVYLLCIALIVSLGIKVTGSLLVGALTIIPAATARNLSGSLKSYYLTSLVLGVVSSIIGLYLFKIFSLPAGPLIILTSSFFFLISLVIKKS